MAKKKHKVIALCSPFQGHIVAATDQGAIINAKGYEDLVATLKELNK